MKNLNRIVKQIVGEDDRYTQANTTVKAFSEVLLDSLDEGQRILFQSIMDAQRVLYSVESEVFEAIGRCA